MYNCIFIRLNNYKLRQYSIFEFDTFPSVLHELADILVVSTSGMLQNGPVMFGKKQEGVFLAQLIQTGKIKYFGAALVLGGFIVLAAVPESRRVYGITVFNVPDNVGKSQLPGFQVFYKFIHKLLRESYSIRMNAFNGSKLSNRGRKIRLSL